MQREANVALHRGQAVVRGFGHRGEATVSQIDHLACVCVCVCVCVFALPFRLHEMKPLKCG